MAEPEVVLITGLSGSGKSVAAAALEDLGFYRVDNLPISLLRSFLEDPAQHVGDHQRVVVVTDVRAPGFAESAPSLLDELERSEVAPTLLFLEASDDVLQRRYSETRRAHPLGKGERPVIDGIRRERELLQPIRERAAVVFDSGTWSVHDMRRSIQQRFAHGEAGDELTVSLVSFGFKHGVPAGSDLVFDVRFLTNPYFVPDLRERTGQEPEVQAFLDAEPDFGELVDRLEDLLLFLLPRYRQENRRYLTAAIGCTGGRHRSVATAERLRDRLAEAGWPVRLSHRDSGR